MTRERMMSGKPVSPEEEAFTWSLRPRFLSEYVGQRAVVEKLSVSLEAAQLRGEPQEHLLLHGPPGLGKTTLAHIIAEEMQSRLVTASGPSLTRIADLMGILTNLEQGDVFFIDEIHRLPCAVEEFIYPAMEDFRVDFVVDKGPFSKVINVPLKRFTLIGATTRVGLLSSPLRDRFGIVYHLDFYSPGELETIVHRSAAMLNIHIEDEAGTVLARSARGTPRVVNRLLRRARDYALVRADGVITGEVALRALEMEGIDNRGLDDLDRALIKVIIDYYGGGPVGLDAVAATLSEESSTIEDVVEPYLLKIGFIQRTKRGRMASRDAFRHLGFAPPQADQQSLFE